MSAYLVLAASCFVYLGYDSIWIALDYFSPQYTSTLPRIGFVLMYILSIALGFAVSVMLAWHIYLIIKGESSVENQDFSRYKDICKHRGTEFVNSYDLGPIRNLAVFFNVTSSGYPLYSLLLPFRVPPYSDGVAWARRPGHTAHEGIDEADEFTDEEDGPETDHS
ncbi:hypothetical protein FRB94_000135 [Tulasnella sp. JGI-2019a]|nr:hypothetical protein FRB94_000135 [Tulasnella sp. JGI-2019a]KAG9015819.1 hypothetical protein FRB93_012384 [Tulasnella sp. JGI-2019a]